MMKRKKFLFVMMVLTTVSVTSNIVRAESDGDISVSENEIVYETVSENSVSENTVSENTISENVIYNDEEPVQSSEYDILDFITRALAPEDGPVNFVEEGIENTVENAVVEDNAVEEYASETVSDSVVVDSNYTMEVCDGNKIAHNFRKTDSCWNYGDNYYGELKGIIGFTAKIEGNMLTINSYQKNGETSENESCFCKLDLEKGTGLADVNNKVNWSNSVTLDLSQLEIGQWYNVSADMRTKKKFYYFNTSRLYNINNEWYFCDVAGKSAYEKCIKGQNAFNTRISKINPEDCKSVHPYLIDYEYDVSDWVNKSNELCENIVDDEYKVMAIYEWICNNMFYDWYLYNESNKENPELFPFNVNCSLYPNGVNKLWDRKGGVCYHFAMAFEVMTRAQGIPTVKVTGNNHVWNAVYINGKWHQIDCTYGSCTSATTKDASDKYTSRAFNYQNYASGLGFWYSHSIPDSAWEGNDISSDSEAECWHDSRARSGGCRTWKGNLDANGNLITNVCTYCNAIISETEPANGGTTGNTTGNILPVNQQKETPILTVSKKRVTVKASTKKSKTVKIKAKTNSDSKITYKVSSTPRKAKKYIKVSSKGKVTIKKNAKKGTYKVAVKVAETGKYKAAKTYVKIKVK